jgi:hypothetical protein
MAVSKRTGKKSVAANDFLIPLPPGPPTASDVGTNRPFDNGSAVVDFSPVDLAISYKIYAASAGQTTVTATGASSPIIVTGLKSNILYTFTATGLNDQGVESDPSDPSTPTLITSVPATPAAPTASSPNANQDVVNWLAPANGGKTITGYIWTASDGKTNLTGGNPGGGPTGNTSVTVNQEAGTNQTYTVYAINANGNSLASASSNPITTTFSFAPFGAFGFSPFGAFGFSPFNAFGFSPFMAFGFSPFNAFGFSPFMAFSFSPFGFRPFSFSPFGFSPMCIGAKTKITVLDWGYTSPETYHLDDDHQVKLVAAEDLKIGDKLVCPIWEEFDGDDYLDYEHEKVFYNQLTGLNKKVVYVKDISSKVVTDTVIFNSDPNKHFSTVQPILAKKQGTETFAWELTGTISAGDILMEYNSTTKRFEESLVTNVQILNNIEQTVYRITPEDDMTFVAGDIIAC